MATSNGWYNAEGEWVTPKGTPPVVEQAPVAADDGQLFKDPLTQQLMGLRPEWKSSYETLLDANGNLQDKFKTQAQKIQGGGAWGELARQKQSLEQSQLADQAASQAMSGTAQARSQLAMRGGLSGGSSERIAKQGLLGLMGARQDVGRQGSQQRADIGLQQEGMNREAEKFNVSSQADADKMNLQMIMQDRAAKAADVGAQSQFQQDLWKQQLQAAAAERSAQDLGGYEWRDKQRYKVGNPQEKYTGGK